MESVLEVLCSVGFVSIGFLVKVGSDVGCCGKSIDTSGGFVHTRGYVIVNSDGE